MGAGLNPQRQRALFAALCTTALALLVSGTALAQANHRQFSVESGTLPGELRCPVKSSPIQRRGAAVEELEPPHAEELDQISALLGSFSRSPVPLDLSAPIPRRIALWGDSHLAAGSFAAELRRVLGVQGVRPRATWVPLTMGRPGVLLPLRRFCMDGWRSELAYSSRASRITTGIGLNTLHGEQGAYLWLDLRGSAGEAEIESVELFFNPSADAGSVVISIDGGPEARIPLEGEDSFGRVSISGGGGPLSVFKLRALGPLALHGLKLHYREPPAAALDAFGIPGATVRAWQQLDPAYFSRYFEPNTYDMVLLQFGTNEGNARPFDATAYAQTLDAALANLRQVFPLARCVLLAPGDRGVLLPKSRKKNSKRTVLGESDPALSSNLLRFSAIHAKIFELQQRIGQRHGCHAWSMQSAMGGAGSAYRWLLASPPLMARDLIHFTTPGYQRLAQELADALGWKSGLPAADDNPMPTAPP